MQHTLFEWNEITVSYKSKQKGPEITTSQDIFDYLIHAWPNIEYEESFVIILLDRANNLLGATIISKGSATGTVADPKKMFQIALKAHAQAIILAHNHPSGNTRPSQNDVKISKRCKEIGELLDLPVLDHIIITKDKYFSFADEGMI